MDLGNFAVSTLNQYLKGTDFPATKEEVAQNAEGNGAPQDLLTQIRNAATERFENPEEVSCKRSKAPPTPPTTLPKLSG